MKSTHLSSKYLATIAIVMGSALAVTACGDKKSSDSPAPAPAPSANATQTEGLTLIQNYCTPCHGKSGGIKLESQSDAKAAQSRETTPASELEGGDMPPAEATKKPTDAERQKMITWLKAL